MVYSDCNLKCTFKVINEEFAVLNKWFMINKVSLNVGKTNCIVFDNYKRTDGENLHMNDEVIKQVDNTKFIGTYIDAKLNWNVQLNNVCIEKCLVHWVY